MSLSRRLWLAAPLVAGVAIGVAAQLRQRVDLALARENYRSEQRHESRRVAGSLNRALEQVDLALRTVSQLPGLRELEPDCRGIPDDALRSAQVIYSELAAAGALSELYLVPVGFDPDARAKGSSARSEPCAGFDALVRDREAGLAVAGGAPARIEIYEHREVARQLGWLVQRASARRPEAGSAAFPITTGPEVVTSDHSHFDPAAPDDRDRMGLVISVPLVGRDGGVRGSASAVLLSHALRDLLPNGNYVLRHAQHGIAIEPHFAGQWQQSRAWSARVAPDPTLIFSETLELLAPDALGAWVLWVGAPDAEFEARADVKSARAFQRAGIAGGVALAVLGVLGVSRISESRRRSARRIARLTHIARNLEKIVGD